MRYFYVFFPPESGEADEKAVITVSNREKNAPGGASSGRRPEPRIWLAGAVCLITAVLVCAAVLWKVPGGQPVQDQSGGSGSGSAAPDVTAPRLLGVRDITVALNGTVSYRDGVSAEDDVDGPVAVQIDAAAVDLTAAGEYPVLYSAQDAAGNRAEQTVTVTVVETETVDQGVDEPTEDVTPAEHQGGGGTQAIPLDQVTQEEVDKLADKVLAKIIKSGMSQREKAKAIFNYVNRNIKYVGSSDKSSWLVGAYVGFTRGRGDCYNYFACSKALLTRAGISNVDLHRVGGNSRHYWQLVNTGDGWYHFDACPHPTGYPLYAFMITEAQARAYTRQVSAARKNYYVYDYDACPVTVEGMAEIGSYQPPAPPPEKDPENPDSSQVPENPDGSQVPENPDGSQLPENPDGSQTPGNPDSSQTPENPDGSQPPENPDGSQTPENPDGSQPPENPDGSQTPENPASSQAPENPDASQQNPQEQEGEQQLAA